MRRVNLLSVVVPCYNEQEILTGSHRRLSNVCGKLVADNKITDYELIYVDDGSRDSTLGILEKIFENDKHTRIISLRHNFGHQGAISCGMYYAKGDAVVTIDADLQDPPEKIDEMITHFSEGYDLVLGIRKGRSQDSFSKRFFAQNYYRLLKLMGVNVVYNHGDFRLMAKPLVDEFNSLPERNRFIRAMILNLESHFATVYYDRDVRKGGITKYTPRAMISFCLDGIVSFSYIPLRLALVFGILMFIFALAGILYVFHSKYFGYAAPGWTSTLIPIFAFGGFQLFVLGVIGEYIGRLYIEVKQRPLFVVRKEYSRQVEPSELTAAKQKQ